VGNDPVPGNTYRYLESAPLTIAVSLNGKPADYKIVKGYAVITKSWKKGDVVQLDLPMPVRRIVAISEIKDDINRVALQRGPLVYCFEHADNDGKTMNIVIPDNAAFKAEFKPDMLNGIVAISSSVPVVTVSENGLSVKPIIKNVVAIPFFTWANRGEGQMQIWMPRKITDVRLLSE